MTDRQKLAARYTANELADALELHALDDCGGKTVDTHLCNIAATFLRTPRDAEQVKEAAAKYLEDQARSLRDTHDLASIQAGLPVGEPMFSAYALGRMADAIRAMPLPTSTDNERVLRELERDARDSRFSDELIGNRFRAALRANGSHNHDD